MPDLYGPFDPVLDVNGDPIPGTGVWAQAEWYKYAPTWAPSGVVGTPAVSASAGSFGLTVSGRDISVALGRAWVYGAGYERTSTPWTYSVPANTNSNPRIDRLVLRRDLAAKTVLPTFLQGTPALSPVAPTIEQNDTGQFDLTLFSWTTPGSSGAPLTDVVNERLWVSPSSGDGSSSFTLGAYKTTDTARSATITPTDDPHLVIASVPVGLWSVSGVFVAAQMASSTVPDIRLTLAGTLAAAGPATKLSWLGQDSSSTSPAPPTQFVAGLGAVVVFGTFSVAPTVALVDGVLDVTTAGSLALRWAQGTSDGGAVTLQRGSHLRLTRLA